MTYAEQIEDEKLREHGKEFKRTRIEGGGFFLQRVVSDGYGKSYDGQRKMGKIPNNIPLRRFNKDKGFNPKV